MSYHHYNRIIRHADFEQLTAPQMAALKEVAQAIDPKKPTGFRLSLDEIARRTRYSKDPIRKAMAALVAKGFLGRSERLYASQRYAYELLITCDCSDPELIASCLTPSELKSRRLLDQVADTLPIPGEALEATPPALEAATLALEAAPSGSSKHTTKQLLNNLKTNTKSVFSFDDFVSVLEQVIREQPESETLRAHLRDKQAAFAAAEALIANSKVTITKPAQWLKSALENNPEALSEPGKPKRKELTPLSFDNRVRDHQRDTGQPITGLMVPTDDYPNLWEWLNIQHTKKRLGGAHINLAIELVTGNLSDLTSEQGKTAAWPVEQEAETF